jgi:hypothetical protein
MSKDLLSADWHLRRRVDERFAFKQLVDLAIAEGVDKVIGAGDLLDRQSNRAEAVAFLFAQIDRLEDAGIALWYIQGQHDWDEPPWLAGHRWARHLHKQIIPLGPYSAYGLDFQPFGRLQEELAEIPSDVDMLIAHQGWADWVGADYNPQGDFSQVPEHIAHLYSGDLHHWHLERHKNAGGVKMITCSSGALCQQKINEPHEHYAALMGKDGIIRQQAIKSRVVIDWPPLLTQEDLQRFVAQIEEALAVAQQRSAAMDLPETMCAPRLRVTYSYRLPEAVRRVEKVLAGRAHLFWKERPPEDKVVDKTKPKQQGGAAVTPLSVLPDEVNKEEEPEVFELAARLLQAANPEEEFQRWWLESFGQEK